MHTILLELFVFMNLLSMVHFPLTLLHLPNLPRLSPSQFLRITMIRPIRRSIEERAYLINHRPDQRA
jgi:hypothetical protein